MVDIAGAVALLAVVDILAVVVQGSAGPADRQGG